MPQRFHNPNGRNPDEIRWTFQRINYLFDRVINQITNIYTWLSTSESSEPQPYAFIGLGNTDPIQIYDANGNPALFRVNSTRLVVDGTKERWAQHGQIASVGLGHYTIGITAEGYGTTITPLYGWVIPANSECVFWYIPAPVDLTL
jgi:hypothetical protein